MRGIEYTVPEELRYTPTHEWIQPDEVAKIGITDYAQLQLGDIVLVDPPDVGDKVTKGDVFVLFESVKAISDAYSPVDGTVVGVNSRLVETPSLANRDPYGDGWIIEVRVESPSQLDELLDRYEYESEIHS